MKEKSQLFSESWQKCIIQINITIILKDFSREEGEENFKILFNAYKDLKNSNTLI